MRRFLFAIAASMAIALLAGCVGGPKPVEVADITPPIYSLPSIDKSSLHAGVYYSPRFASAEHMRHLGPDTYVLPIGKASVYLFDHAFRNAFARTSRVDGLSPDALAARGVDVAIAPTLVYFNIRHGFDGDGPSRLWSVAYRLTLYSRTGVPVASWIVTGDDPGGYWFDGAKQDLEAAGRAFLNDFQRHAGPALAAMMRNADGKAGSVDPSAVVLTAQPTTVQGIEPDAAAALRQAGMVPIRVSVQSASTQRLVVRGSDTRLVLANGRSVEPASLETVLSALEDPSAGKRAWFLGGILGAVGSAQAQQEQRGQSAALMGHELLADRTLDKGNQASGVVLFHVPGGAQSARGATLRAWVVDPAAATGVQLDAPLTGAQAASASARPPAAQPSPAPTRRSAIEARAEEKPKPGIESKPAAVRKSSTPASVAAVPSTSLSAPPVSEPEVGPGGLRAGERWEYRFVDSRDGRAQSRQFEISQADRQTIVERVTLADGGTLLAQHRGGAYLDLAGGMQFAPYYLAFGGTMGGSIDGLRAQGGDACATRRVYGGDYASSFECLIRAEFSGSEEISVPAGTFRANRVRVAVDAERIGGAPGPRTIPVLRARYWIAPRAGRLVKGVVEYDAEQPWTETMELVSKTTAGSVAQRVTAPPVATARPAPAVPATALPPDGVLLGDLLAMGGRKLSPAETRAALTSGTLRGVTPDGAVVVASYSADGRLTGSVNGNDMADGKWRIDGSGRSCIDVWIPRYRRTYENLCRYWFKFGEALYFPSESDSDANPGARMSKRTLTPR